ncbi:putative bifunctional diguanylate cyclase/phosphodiesterase [Crassaminicella profunda]|uniref:putative bifunctional diguanylate cyclase/phosphodiesterase n=1 Tax=Crassaminicella profunda TaxID=1286698 RepID=UPI001CA761BD|nr:GGDEF domain-containing phosphodiesterase [Crassaminicella profunda]QZY57285.1 EAL domain-containing protein [Crassaminicella profunda]
MFFNGKKDRGFKELFATYERSMILNKKFQPKSISLKITALYLLVGCLWIIFSDRLLQIVVKDLSKLTLLQTFKGWFYVVATAGMLYIIIYRTIEEKECWEKKLLESYEKLEFTHEELIAAEEDLEGQVVELQKSQKALRKSEERFRLAMEGASDGIWDWDIVNNKLLFTRTKALLGFEESEIENSIGGWINLVHLDDLKCMNQELEKHLKRQTHYYENQYRMRTKDGSYKWILSRGKAIFDKNSKPIRMAGSHQDITHYKIAEENIYKLAYYDSLTGLPNRTFFEEKLSQALKEAKKNDYKVAVLYMDLDNFKNVNDTLGHMYGDELLKDVAKLLKRVVPAFGEVTRLGGDEFGIWLPKIMHDEDVISIIENIIGSFQKPWILRDREFYITATIGISLYPEQGKEIYEIIKNADTAMYSAKENGKNNYKFYTPLMNKQLLEKLEMKNNLRHAIKRNEFTLYYQPQIDMNSRKIIGLEVLIRWSHPTLGLIPPYKFIPIAEESNLIIAIGEWVLKTACKQNSKWIKMGFPPLKIAVNLSARQFQQKNLVKAVSDILQKTKIKSELLELEITESLAMKDLNFTIKILKKLRKLGLKISLDDFGTGYSSLNYLKVLPIDTLKMDKTFVDNITESKREQLIAKSVIDLAHGMDLMVTAEGVETKDQFFTLKELQCNKAQGYFFSKPLPTADIEELLKKGYA